MISLVECRIHSKSSTSGSMIEVRQIMSMLEAVAITVGLLASAVYLVSCLINHENPFFYYEYEEQDNDQDQSIV